MKYINFIIAFGFLFFTFKMSSQIDMNKRIENEFIIKLKSGYKIEDVLYANKHTMLYNSARIEKLGTDLFPVYKMKVSNLQGSSDEIIKTLYALPSVETVQYNHYIQLRNTPDDPKYPSQWSLNNTGQSGGVVNADIDADKAWDITTGGLTKSGDTIVIAVIDNGADLGHEDLIGNLWKNYSEIPDDSIDNDGNGYIDDFDGWNAENNTDNIKKGSHGTAVAGIIGAKANNNKGIAGINWNIKMMIISFETDEASIIAAYLYALKMRELYNETNGEKGAYVVATNLSSGINKANPEEYPLWCSLYDELGEAGIINVCATSNISVNVDEEGDMPTACASDYMLSVTNIDKYNNLYSTASYGAISVDVGAYGEGTISTRPGNDYYSFGGCSAAAPHACGIVGLLYSQSESLVELSKTYPANASLLVKDVIMSSVTSLDVLKDKTVTGGVVNAYNSLLDLERYENECAPPVKLVFDTIAAGYVKLKWDDYDEDKKYNLQYKPLGGDWIEIKDVQSPCVINNLEYCTEYVFRLQVQCGDTYSDYSFEIKSGAKGCCDPPVINNHILQDDTLTLFWDNILVADEYLLLYKFWTAPNWDTLTVKNDECKLPFQYECGDMVVALQSLCDVDSSRFSDFYYVGEECGYCDSSEYCSPDINNRSEWIDNFSLEDFSNLSGSNKDGHDQYNTPSMTLLQGKSYEGIVDIGFKTQIFDDFLMIWIDLNRNNIFEPEEKLFSGNNGDSLRINYSITIPENANKGFTRMRVLLCYSELENPCLLNDNYYGEYEDYCIYIDDNECDAADVSLDTVSVGVNDALLQWTNPLAYKYFYILYKKNNEPKGYAIVKDTFYHIDNLDTCSQYSVQIEPYCEFYKHSGNFSYIDFKTRCADGLDPLDENNIRLFPNPVTDALIINSDTELTDVDISVYDIFGHRLYYKKYDVFDSTKIPFAEDKASGLYFVIIKKDTRQYIFKVVK